MLCDTHVLVDLFSIHSWLMGMADDLYVYSFALFVNIALLYPFVFQAVGIGYVLPSPLDALCVSYIRIYDNICNALYMMVVND